MSGKKPIDDEDRALFLDAIGDVKRLEHDRIAPAGGKRKSPEINRSLERDDRSVMDSLLDELSEADFLDTGEHLAYTAPGVQRSVLKRLKTGRYSIQAELDLHGMTVEQARRELSAFLKECQQSRKLCVRVIHGRARHHAEHAPRIKQAVNQWLQRHAKVLAFCSARNVDGGTGAVYVLLSRRD